MTGSFDPFTIGHADVAQRALALCDELVIGIGYNGLKAGWIPVDERLRALREFYAREPRVRVEKYSCVRGMADFDYETRMAETNRRLSGIETLLLPAKPGMAHVSSSMARELARFGKDITPWLPQGLNYII